MTITGDQLNMTVHTDLTNGVEFVVFSILASTLGMTIVFGNLLIICAMCRFRMLKSPNHVMIVSLALGDLTIGGVYLPLKIFQNHHPFLDRISCLANLTLSFFCVGLAMSFLSMLSIERFYAVQFPFHYHTNMTVTRSMVWNGITLVTVFLLVVPIFSGIDLWSPNKHCYSFTILPARYIWTVSVVVSVILLCGFLSFVRVLVAEIRLRRRDGSHSVSQSRQSDSVKCTLMLIVYVLSLVCWFPQIIHTIVSALQPASSNMNITRVVSLLALCSSGINCFIYGFKNSTFRDAFRKMIPCRTRRAVSSTASSTNVTVSSVAHAVNSSDVTSSAVHVGLTTSNSDLNLRSLPGYATNV